MKSIHSKRFQTILQVFTRISAQYLEQVNKVKRLRNESWEKEQIDKITQQNQQLEIEYQKLFAVWQQTEKDAQAEAEGISGSGKRGKGIAYTDKKQLANNLKDSADKVQQEIELNKKRIQELNTQIETKISVENLSGDKPGIIRQLGTLEKLAHDDPNIAKIDFFISLLFILLEVSPVIVKLMSDTGSYDELVTQQENTKIHQFQEEYKVKKNQITAEVKDASDIQQELRLQTKMKIIRLLQEQFSQLMQQVNDPNNPQVQAIQSQALKIMLDNLKYQMLKQARLFKVMGYEIEEELHRSKQRMLQQNVQQKVKHTVTKAKVERL